MPNFSPTFTKNYNFSLGKGAELIEGSDAILFTYGQTMITESSKAAKILKKFHFQ